MSVAGSAFEDSQGSDRGSNGNCQVLQERSAGLVLEQRIGQTAEIPVWHDRQVGLVGEMLSYWRDQRLVGGDGGGSIICQGVGGHRGPSASAHPEASIAYRTGRKATPWQII